MTRLQRWTFTVGFVLTVGTAMAQEQSVRLETVEDLTAQYPNIFKTMNRNAASHLWVSFLLDHASSLPVRTFSNLFKGFCAVSGSPLPDDPQTRYKVTLPNVGGGTETGVVRYCCWPCICDTVDLMWVDTKTIHTADGPQQFRWLVIGDPCKHPENLKAKFTDPFSGTETRLDEQAPEVKCNGGRLLGANFSDHGHPIIGMLSPGEEWEVGAPIGSDPNSDKDDPTFGYKDQCQERKKEGYNSGMGLIFHLVGNIAPIGGDVMEEKFSTVRITPEVTNLTNTIGLVALAVMLSALVFFALVRLRNHSLGQSSSHVETDMDSSSSADEAPTE